MSVVDAERFIEILTSMIDRAIETDSKDAAGAIEFNLANVFRKRDQYQEAVTHLQRAFDHRQIYSEIPGCWDLLGGAAFRAGQYVVSAEAYTRAVQLDASVPRAQAHLADALMYAGRYRKAIEVIDGAYGSSLVDKLSIVNRIALQEVMSVTGLENQERRLITDEEIDSIESNQLEPFDLLKNVDALEPGLWSRLEGDPAHWTMPRAILLARLSLADPEIWAIATILSYADATMGDTVLNKIVDMALNDAGDGFVDALEQFLEGSGPPMADLLELARERALLFSRPRQPFMLLDSAAHFWVETDWTSRYSAHGR
jgi:tetratricopeptide (TPR) repeat protein